jgi:PPOX class probable F420-dependent enzyme
VNRAASGLTPPRRALLDQARTATLATIGATGRARLVPVCFVLEGDVIATPIDEKAKRLPDPMSLGRIRDIQARPEVTLLVERWSEDWAELAWVRIEGRATVVPSTPIVVDALRAKYPQYASHDLEARPMIEVAIDRVTSWGV